MNRRRLFFLTLGGVLLPALPAIGNAVLPPVEVFKSPTCGCCGAWVEHMRAAGFVVDVTNVDDTTAARKRFGMPDTFGSCHTALVGGYVVEGHVPAADVKRLLGLKASAVGLSVPGMVPGSPGMEVGSRHDPYKVFLVDRNGRATVFASYFEASTSRP